jgi:hypothetical protein
VLDHDMQERPMPSSPVRIPRLTMPAFRWAIQTQCARRRGLLIAAEIRGIAAGRMAGRQPSMTRLVELAELPAGAGQRRAAIAELPVASIRWPVAAARRQPTSVLNLEVQGGGGHGISRDAARANAKTINISSLELFIKSKPAGLPAPGGRDIVMAADAKATLPLLIDGGQATADAGSQARAAGTRRRRSPDHHRHERAMESRRRSAGTLRRSAWRGCARSCGSRFRTDDWSLVSWQGFISGWPGRLWNIDKHYHYIGGQGAGAMGYGAPAPSAPRSRIASTAG